MVYYPTTWQGWVLLIIGMLAVFAVYVGWDAYKEKKAKSWPKTFKSKSGQRYTFADMNELQNAALAGNVDYNAKTWADGYTVLLAVIVSIVNQKNNRKISEAWIRGYISGMVQKGGDLSVRSNNGTSPLGYAVYGGDEIVARILREYGAR
jgi:hypothetical protein